MKEDPRIRTRRTYEDPTVVARYHAAYGEDFHRVLAKDFLQTLPGKRVLDLGCGPGHYTRYFSELGFEAVGVDYSQKMIEAAKKHKGIGNPLPWFVVGDMERLQSRFPANSFDGVWANASLLHISLAELGVVTLEGIKHVLRDGGKLFIRTKAGETGEQTITEELYGKEITRRFTFWTQEDLERALRESGFSHIQTVDEHEDVRVEKSERSIDWLQVTAQVEK